MSRRKCSMEYALGRSCCSEVICTSQSHSRKILRRKIETATASAASVVVPWVVQLLTQRKTSFQENRSAGVATVYSTVMFVILSSHGSTIIFTARCYASAVFAVIQCLSVCLSVRPSVTFVEHVKTKHVEIFAPSGSDTILFFPYQRGADIPTGTP